MGYQETGESHFHNIECDALSICGTAVITAAEMEYLDGVTIGVACGSQAVVLDACGSVSGITDISSIGRVTVACGVTASSITASSVESCGTVTTGKVTAASAITASAVTASALESCGTTTTGKLTAASAATASSVTASALSTNGNLAVCGTTTLSGSTTTGALTCASAVTASSVSVGTCGDITFGYVTVSATQYRLVVVSGYLTASA